MLDIETQEEKVLPISFFVSGLLTSFSTAEIDVCKTFCTNRRLDSSADVPLGRDGGSFFLKNFSTYVHVHFFGHPSHSWAVAFDIHFDSCAGSAHHTEHSSIFLGFGFAECLAWLSLFLLLLSMFTAICNVAM